VQFYIVSSHDNSHIQVNKGAIRFLTSPHADGYDGYSFVVPRGLDHIHASEILSAKFERNALTFSDNSEILIDSGSASCSLTLKLFDNKGEASILNGTYVVKEYAGAAFKRCQR